MPTRTLRYTGYLPIHVIGCLSNSPSIVRPDAAGSSGKDLVKDLDFMGYIEIRNNKRTISFNPSEKFYAKNSLRLPDVIEIPDTAQGNHFIQTFILDKTIERMKQDDIEGEKYNTLIASMMPTIEAVVDEKTADEALATITTSLQWRRLACRASISAITARRSDTWNIRND